MGAPMVARLVAGGHEVIGFDVAETARRRFGEAEAAREDRGHLAEGAETVILMLPNSEVVASVLARDLARAPGARSVRRHEFIGATAHAGPRGATWRRWGHP